MTRLLLLAALTAALAQQPLSVPAGWKLVPTEPDQSMIDVYRAHVKPRPFHRTAARAIREIIDAAPTVGGEQG